MIKFFARKSQPVRTGHITLDTLPLRFRMLKERESAAHERFSKIRTLWMAGKVDYSQYAAAGNAYNDAYRALCAEWDSKLYGKVHDYCTFKPY